MKHEWGSRSEIRMFNCENFFYFFLAKLVKSYKNIIHPFWDGFKKTTKKHKTCLLFFKYFLI